MNESSNKKPYNIRGNLAVKIITGIMLVAMCTIALASLLGIIVLAQDDAFNKYSEKDFYESTLCRWATNENVWNAIQVFYSAPDEAYEIVNDNSWRYYPDHSNILFYAEYIATGVNGVTVSNNGYPYGVVQTCDGETVSTKSFEYWTYFHDDSNGIEGQVRITAFIRSTLLDNGDGLMQARDLFYLINNNKAAVVACFAVTLVLAIALLIFMFCSAGRKRGTEGVYLSWFDRIPLDILALILLGASALLLTLTVESGYYGVSMQYIVVEYLALVAISLALLAFLITLATRIKAKTVLKNTAIYLWIWKGTVRCVRYLKRKTMEFFHMLPLVWRSALLFSGFAMLSIILSYAAFEGGSGGFVILLLGLYLLLFAAVIAAAYQMRMLQKSGEELSKGNMSYKANTEKMLWDFKKHGDNLNSISEGMSIAVEERMKSESFKTELITNVSHDIKTPLTSIINYVDLLKKEETSGKAAEYIDVLDRQSARLKKLTEDLVEASKASSGTITVNKSKNDVSELLRQALGEYKERLEDAQVAVVVTEPEHPVDIICDGRLMWRVFDNLLGNICKYSQPGTRAFIDIDEDGGKLWMFFKNTSREVLNISAEALMERFVRGDRSRNSEGSGLGLSIARSLMELQGGTFSLFLDGDLFKVIMTMPK